MPPSGKPCTRTEPELSFRYSSKPGCPLTIKQGAAGVSSCWQTCVEVHTGFIAAFVLHAGGNGQQPNLYALEYGGVL